MKIVQTPYIDYEDRNRLFLLPEEGEGWNRARLTLPGWEGEVTLTPRGGEALVPRVRQETCLYAELWDGAGRYARTQTTLGPVKEWKVGFMLSSHEDLGYEDKSPCVCLVGFRGEAAAAACMKCWGREASPKEGIQ